MFLGEKRCGQTSFLHALAKLPILPSQSKRPHDLPLQSERLHPDWDGLKGGDPDAYVEERLKCGLLKSKSQNLPELAYSDIPHDLQNDLLDLLPFRRQTVFVIFFSIEQDPDSQTRKLIDCFRKIASIQISCRHVRFVIVCTKIDLVSGNQQVDLLTRFKCILPKHFSDMQAESDISIMFVTSIGTHVQYEDLRRKLKSHIFSLSKSIFESPVAIQLRFPDCYRKVLDSVDALRKKSIPGDPMIFQIQNLKFGYLDGAHKDTLKLDALKMLHEVGETTEFQTRRLVVAADANKPHCSSCTNASLDGAKSFDSAVRLAGLRLLNQSE